MRVCELTGKRRNVGYNVSHANNKTKKIQQPNLQKKRIFVPEENRSITLTLSTRAIRSINKLGFIAYVKKLGLDPQKIIASKS